MFSEILHVPDLWIFRAQKIRPQIGFCPQIGCPQIGWCTVYRIKENSRTLAFIVLENVEPEGSLFFINIDPSGCYDFSDLIWIYRKDIHMHGIAWLAHACNHGFMNFRFDISMINLFNTVANFETAFVRNWSNRNIFNIVPLLRDQQ